jgi:hypothetical protein
MTVKYSDTARNAMLDALSTTYAASMKLRLYSGTEPTDESTALSGNTMLAEFTMAPSAAATGSKQFVPSTLTATAAAAGTATFYRVYNSAGTTCHEQGSVGQGTGDLSLDNTVITSGQTVNITSFTKTAPG